MEFSVGDWVYLKIQPYRLKSLARKCNEKLSPRFYGPYKVLEKVERLPTGWTFLLVAKFTQFFT